MPQVYQDMTMMNIHEAKTHLSKIIEEVSTLGKPIVIAKAGQPKVKIVPVETQQTIKPRLMGFLCDEQGNSPQGWAEFVTNFDKHNAEIEALFCGDDDENFA